MFPIKVAWRYLLSGGSQTILTLGGVALGVTVYIFISTLITGLQRGLINRTIGSISHVTLEMPEEEARIIAPAGTQAIGPQQPFNAREERIRGWQQIVPALDKFPGVRAVSPAISTSGFATRGGTTRPVTLIGIQEDRGAQIIDLRGFMRSGSLNLAGQGCAIGVELARLLGLEVGDKITVRSAQGIERAFTVTGIFDAGNININERSFYISLANGQRLADQIGSISRIEIQIDQVFQANALSEQIGAKTGLRAKSWMQENTELLGALQSQSGTTQLIRIFVLAVVATGVASVLIVSVLQRSREIGILMSMGARGVTILKIFLWLGFFLGFFGAFLGVSLGGLAVLGMAEIPGTNPFRPGKLFPIFFETQFLIESLLAATIVGLVASIPPARRASKMNPVDVIRYG